MPATGSGVAVDKRVTVTPTSLKFGSQLVGGQPASLPVTVTNTGNVDWTWTSAHTSSPEFNLAGGSCFVLPLAPGGSCTFNATFAPSAVGSRIATITLASSAGSITLTATSTGVAPVRKVAVSPQLLYFGAVVAGSTTSRAVTVTNTGNVSWAYTGASIKGASSVSVTGGSCSPASPVQPGKSCTIALTFRPAAAQLLLADLAITGSAGTSHVVLTAIAVPQIKLVSYSATKLAFGSQLVGSHTAKTITIHNIGNVDWSPSSLQLQAGQPFTISSSSCLVGAVLAPGQSCTVTVSFAPTKTGPASSVLTTVGSFGTNRISLTGTAKAAR